jgi:hypothetical protein
MTLGKLLLRTIVVAVVMFALGYVGHQLLLGRDYVAIEPLMRSKADMMGRMPFALINSLVFSAACVWLYSQGRSAKPRLVQGFRFGVAVWALASVPLYLANYVIEPWPGVFVAKILAWELVTAILLGVSVARLSKNDAEQSKSAGA